MRSHIPELLMLKAQRSGGQFNRLNILQGASLHRLVVGSSWQRGSKQVLEVRFGHGRSTTFETHHPERTAPVVVFEVVVV